MQELGGDGLRLDTHHHLADASAQQVPEARVAVRVMNGDVDQRRQLFAHRVDHEGDTAGPGLEQVAVG